MRFDARRVQLVTLAVIGSIAGALVFVAVARVLLATIANIVWAFVVTPGGIIAVVLLWKWMSLQEARARRRKKS